MRFLSGDCHMHYYQCFLLDRWHEGIHETFIICNVQKILSTPPCATMNAPIAFDYPQENIFFALTLSVIDTSKDLIFWCTFITFVNIVNYGVEDIVFVHSLKVYTRSRIISALD